MIQNPAEVAPLIRSKMASLLDEARRVLRVPENLTPTAVQIFYLNGQPVEARVLGQYDVPLGGKQPWVSDPAPRWAEGGELLPEDAARPHRTMRADGNMSIRHAPDVAWFAHQRLEDLTGADADLPEEIQTLARLVLKRLAAREENAAAYALTEAGASWRDRLVRELKRRLAELRQVAGLDGYAPPADGAEVTRRAAQMAETFEREGKVKADELRRRSAQDSWAPWWPEEGEDFAFVLRMLALLVWRNGLQDEAERARARRPALVRAVVMDELVAVQTGQLDLPTLESRELRAGKRIVATIDAGATDLAVVRQGIHVLRTVTGHRLVKDLVLTAHRQYEADGFDPRTVEYLGGWSGLAEAIGYSTGRGFSDLRALAEAGRFIRWQSGDGGHRGGGWWMWSEKRGGPGVTGKVRFVLNDPLLPGYASALGDVGGTATTARAARRLVPELPHEPPMGVLHDHYHGAAWSLHRLVLVYLVDRAEELAEHGLVVVTKDRWEQLAARAGLPIVYLPKLLESWEEDENEKAPALIARNGDGLRLADHYAAETAFIVEAGRNRIAGRKGGRSRKAKG